MDAGCSHRLDSRCNYQQVEAVKNSQTLAEKLKIIDLPSAFILLHNVCISLDFSDYKFLLSRIYKVIEGA